MKKFLLALGVIAMTFSVTACGDDDNNDNNNDNGSNTSDDNGGNGSSSSSASSDLSSAIDKYCAKEEECGGRTKSDCKAANDPDSVTGNCVSLVTKLYNCIGKQSCSTLGDEDSDVCQNELMAAYQGNCITTVMIGDEGDDDDWGLDDEGNDDDWGLDDEGNDDDWGLDDEEDI
jgi:hypothetical protein